MDRELPCCVASGLAFKHTALSISAVLLFSNMSIKEHQYHSSAYLPLRNIIAKPSLPPHYHPFGNIPKAQCKYADSVSRRIPLLTSNRRMSSVSKNSPRHDSPTPSETTLERPNHLDLVFSTYDYDQSDFDLDSAANTSSETSNDARLPSYTTIESQFENTNGIIAVKTTTSTIDLGLGEFRMRALCVSRLEGGELNSISRRAVLLGLVFERRLDSLPLLLPPHASMLRAFLLIQRSYILSNLF